jgi:hypothetical protein
LQVYCRKPGNNQRGIEQQQQQMNIALIQPLAEPSETQPHRTSKTDRSLAESWTEAERTVTARRQKHAVAKARAESEARDRTEAERVRFAHD